MGLMHWKSRGKYPVTTIGAGIFMIVFGVLLDYRFIEEMIKEKDVGSYILFGILIIFFSILTILTGFGIVSMGVEELKAKRNKERNNRTE